MPLNEPGALYDAPKALDLQDMLVMAECDPDAMLWQKRALKTQAAHPTLTPILARTERQYRTTWVKGLPISHKSEVQVHAHHHLGVEGRLAAYELVGPSWQLNVINVHVPFGDATETFLEHLMEAYRQLAMMGPTVIIGDFNAAPSAVDRGGGGGANARGHGGANGHATHGPTRTHSLPTSSLAQQIPASTPATLSQHTSR